MTDALLVGLSGLQSHQRAIEVTSHNIANSTTPGYTRQRADLVAATPENIPAGQIGRGVTVEAIHRLANDLLIERQRQAVSEDGRLSRLTETLKTAESIFNEPGDNGLSASINQLFASFEDLSNNPESTALRSSAVAQMGTFTDTLNNLGDRLQQLRDDIHTALDGEVGEINELTSGIAKLNQQIRDQTVVGNNPNDLLDHRDQLVSELSGKLGLRVRTMASDGSVMIDSGGVLLVGRDYAEQLSVGANADGSLTLLLSNKTSAQASGGSAGALVDLHGTILPKLIDDIDSLTSSLALELNARQSTGTNHSFKATTFTSEYAIDASLTATNLDDAAQIQGENGGPGMPQVFLPSFTDANGNLVARNLDINIYDPATGLANKYVLRYDPATGGGARSLDDLVSTINSGRSTLSGGFTLYPPQAGGINGLSARKVPIDGGYRLELSASAGKTIDFSRALDVQPTSTAWTSGTTSVTGSDPALAGKRVVFTVAGGSLQATTRDPVSGVQSAYGVPLALGGAAGVIGGLSLTLTPGAGNYTNGDSFAVDFTSTGAVVGTTATQTKSWTQGDAAMTVRGRYTGDVTFAPGREWSMRVITGGTIGAATGAPLVEFTFLTGSADAPVQQKIQKVLDTSTPAGTPIPIGDGVYAVFSAGTLSTAGNQTSFIVDSDTDQARLLPALGINTLFSGATAATVQVSAALRADANRLAVGTSRAEGDNSNLADLAAVRSAKIFAGGTTSVDEYYHTTVTGLGVRVSENKRLQDSQQLLRTSLENQRQEVSGVSIDEEVAFLILQQQAYTASARVITTSRENITTLLELVR